MTDRLRPRRARGPVVRAALEALECRRLLAATPTLDAGFAGDGRAEFFIRDNNFQVANEVLAVGNSVYAFGGGTRVEYPVGPSNTVEPGVAFVFSAPFVDSTTVARLTADGRLDRGFGNGGTELISSTALAGWSDYQTVLNGNRFYASRIDGLGTTNITFQVARFNENLTLDASFPRVNIPLDLSGNDGTRDYGVDYSVDSDGNVLVAKFVDDARFGDIQTAEFSRHRADGTAGPTGSISSGRIEPIVSRADGSDVDVAPSGFREVELLNDGSVYLGFSAFKAQAGSPPLPTAGVVQLRSTNFLPMVSRVGFASPDGNDNYAGLTADPDGTFLLVKDEDEGNFETIASFNPGSFIDGTDVGGSQTIFEGAAVAPDVPAYLVNDPVPVDSRAAAFNNAGGFGDAQFVSRIKVANVDGSTPASLDLTPASLTEYAYATDVTATPSGDLLVSGYVLQLTRRPAFGGEREQLVAVSSDAAVWRVKVVDDTPPPGPTSFTIDVNGTPRVYAAGATVSTLEQDAGGARPIAGGLELTGNAWKHLGLSYNVTKDTVLEFTVKTPAGTPAEIIALGFDDNRLPQDVKRVFRVGGSQPFGNSFPLGDQQPGTTANYKVRVGDFYTGSMSWLSFVKDDDANAAGPVAFTNIKVYEDPRTPPPPPPPGPEKLIVSVNGQDRFYDRASFRSPTRQDAGSVDLSAAGDRDVALVGNAWKHLPLDYDVTKDTVLTFTATTAVGGEITAIGFDDDLDPQNTKRVFKFAGSDPFDLAYPIGNQPAGTTQTYRVRVGDSYTGAMKYLSFVGDDDTRAAARTIYSDIRITEEPIVTPPPPPPPPSAAFREVNGVVTIDAAAPTGTGNASAAAQWTTTADRDAIDGSAIIALPNSGFNSGDSLTGDRQDYAIDFASAGTYYVHVRLAGANGNDNSVHVGLNGGAASLGGFGVGPKVADGTYSWASTVENTSRRIVVNVPSAGRHTLNLWVREDGVQVDDLRVAKSATYDPAAPSNPTPPTLPPGTVSEVDGVVAIEAAASTGGTGGGGGTSWDAFARPGAIGGRAVQAFPNRGFNSGDALAGDRLDYSVNFASSGTYYVWVRLAGDDKFDNSVHVGLNGTASTFGGFGMGSDPTNTAYQWTGTVDGNGRRVTINVPSAGLHKLNLWVREDGVNVDEIRVAKSASYAPT